MEKADGGIFRGACEPGEQWDALRLQQKLVGARYYPEAFVADVPAGPLRASEFLSPRDGDGHGIAHRQHRGRQLRRPGLGRGP